MFGSQKALKIDSKINLRDTVAQLESRLESLRPRAVNSPAAPEMERGVNFALSNLKLIWYHTVPICKRGRRCYSAIRGGDNPSARSP